MFIAEGRLEASEGQEPTLMISELRSLDDAVANRARELSIRLPDSPVDEAYLESLYSLLERERGRCSVVLTMNAGDTLVRLEAGGLGVEGSRVLQRDLEARGCIVDWVH
jgi:hypothetical protein